MPNFKAKRLKNLTLPFKKNEVSFLWEAKSENIRLVFTRVREAEFFLQIKSQNEEFIIKADKHSKPAKISYLQRALELFKENFCEEILSESFKDKALQETCIVKDFDELKEILKDKKIYVEIGFGSGRHLLYQARKNPQILMLGIETYTPSLNQVLKLAKPYKNILLAQSDARLLLSVLEPKSVDKIFLHFPVPWEKKPHRRVVSSEFCKECTRVLSKNGSFELRTDSFEYFEFAFREFLEFKNAIISVRKNENLEISSKYEDRWKRQEKDIYDLKVSNLQTCFEKLDIKEPDFKALKFSKQNLASLQKELLRRNFKGEDFFINFQNFYILKNGTLLLKLSFGAFNKPEKLYLLLNEGVEFLFKKPFKTKENLKALNKLGQIFTNFL